jgi:sensor histidine kinase YesM
MMCDGIIYIFIISTHINSILINTGIATAICTFLVEQLFEYSLSNRIHHELDKVHLLAILSIPVGSIIIGVLTMYHYSLRDIAVASILITFNILVFYIYDKLQKSYETAYENRMLEQAIEAKNTEVKLVKEAEEKISFLRHDFKNHLISIEMYAESNDCNGIIKYIHSAFDFLKIENQVTHSGNFDVDSILNYKLQEMKQKNVDITCSVNIPCELNIDDFDINIILGNLLNNAMEAMDKVEKKIFYLRIYFDNNAIFISMRNTYDGNEKKSGKSFITTKEDKCLHGIGLKSVEKILKKYNGTLSCFTNKKSNVFVTEAMLYNIPINRH